MKKNGDNKEDPQGQGPVERPRVLTLKEYTPITTWEGLETSGELCARIIKINNRIFLDIRERTFVPGTKHKQPRTSESLPSSHLPASDNTKGFTSHGIRLMIRDIAKLRELLPDAEDEIRTRLMLRRTQQEYDKMYSDTEPQQKEVTETNVPADEQTPKKDT